MNGLAVRPSAEGRSADSTFHLRFTREGWNAAKALKGLALPTGFEPVY
jgi:hypothetical protein